MWPEGLGACRRTHLILSPDLIECDLSWGKALASWVWWCTLGNSSPREVEAGESGVQARGCMKPCLRKEKRKKGGEKGRRPYSFVILNSQAGGILTSLGN